MKIRDIITKQQEIDVRLTPDNLTPGFVSYNQKLIYEKTTLMGVITVQNIRTTPNYNKTKKHKAQFSGEVIKTTQQDNLIGRRMLFDQKDIVDLKTFKIIFGIK